MARPLFIYRLDDLRTMRVLQVTEGFTLRIEKPTYRVWLSNNESTVRVEELAPDNGPWSVVEEYPAR